MSYQKAVRWIALNDEPQTTELRSVAVQTTVLMLADVYRRLPVDIALDVITERERADVRYAMRRSA